MKATKKTSRRAKTRRDNDYNEENIFNPFSPLLAWLKRPGKRKKEYSEHPFRDSFITVVLLHVIAVLSFLAYGAIKDATKSPTARATTKDQKDSRVARILEKQPTLLPSEAAKPGEKLVAVREPDPFRTEKDATAEAPAADRENVSRKEHAAQTSFAAIEEPLPPVTTNPKPSVRPEAPTATRQTTNNGAAKEAFLAATGRQPRSEEVATVNEPEIRRPERVANNEPAPSTPKEAVAPAVSEYTVQPGDNIFTISRRMNVSFTELAAANNLSSPRDVRVGQVLVSPTIRRDAM